MSNTKESVMGTQETQRAVEAKVQEIISLLQENGYDQADVEITALPVNYSGNRRIDIWEGYDWKPSDQWDGSSC